MVLILSIDGDITTNEVIEWLIVKGVPFARFNDNDMFTCEFKCFIENGEIKFILKKNGETIHSDEISIVWYRKFGFYNYVDEYVELKNSKNIDLIRQFTNEYFSITKIIFSALKSKKWLFNIEQATCSKYWVLSEAEKAGLKIPVSEILNTKKELKNFAATYKSIITKSTKEASFIKYDQSILTMFTTEVVSKEISSNTLPYSFMPSMVQPKIDKKYELRIFFVGNKFYPMAIFSQADKQTEIDFRKYNNECPNRCVPYILPEEIKQKLKKLMKNIGLNTGSIDMIYTKDKEYVFLEVNPSGQFGMTSKPCNYNLEEQVANYLKTNR